MRTINNIMSMLDWNMTLEKQSEGRRIAKELGTIAPFIQPVTPEYNKNVWKNCAIIVSEQEDEKIKPYLCELLEWLQDMNWPGAFCIYNRLLRYKDNKSLFNAIDISYRRAEKCHDSIWERNIDALVSERFILVETPNDYGCRSW